jgi:dynein heavy chain 1
MITLPVYLNATRSELLFTIELEAADKSLNEFDFYERGVAVLTSTIA